MPLGGLRRQRALSRPASFRPMPRIDEARSHGIQRIADMDLNRFGHCGPSSRAARTAAMKSATSCSGETKR